MGELREWLPKNTREADVTGWSGSSADEREKSLGLRGWFPKYRRGRHVPQWAQNHPEIGLPVGYHHPGSMPLFIDTTRIDSCSGQMASFASLTLTSRFRLTPSSATRTARARCVSGGSRTMNFPLYLRSAIGSGAVSLTASISARESDTSPPDAGKRFFRGRCQPGSAMGTQHISQCTLHLQQTRLLDKCSGRSLHALQPFVIPSMILFVGRQLPEKLTKRR